MKKYLFLLLILCLIPSLIYGAGINISALPDGGSTVDKASVMVGNIGSRTGTTSRFTIAELFGIYIGTLTDGKFCTYNSSTGKINCASSGYFDQTGNYTITGTWDFSGATITPPSTIPTIAGDNTFTGTNIFKNTVSFQKSDATPIAIMPTEPPTTTTTFACATMGVCGWVSTTANCLYKYDSTSETMTCVSPSEVYGMIQPYLFDADGDGTTGEAGDEISDEQLICGNVNSTLYTLKSCGAKVTDNSTSSNAIYKDSSGYIANQPTVIDAHAASTTITLIPNICPIIHNASQADENVNNTLPAVGAGKCFVALATSAEADKYWRLTAAAVNTICLNRTCGKDYIQFDTPAVGDTFTCMSDGTNWYCYDRDSDATVGDL